MAGKISSRRSSPGCIGGKPRFGSFLVMNLSSMIVFQLDVDSIAFDPAKCNAPVSAGADRIAAFIAANERMKAKPQGTTIQRSRITYAWDPTSGDSHGRRQ